MTAYSPRGRTALVLSGTGTAGAYHAGVLKALGEAGVRIDVVAGCGIGAVGALLAAVDSAEQLWGERDPWRSAEVARFYGWRAAPRRLVGLAGVVLLALVAWTAGRWLVDQPWAVQLGQRLDQAIESLIAGPTTDVGPAAPVRGGPGGAAWVIGGLALLALAGGLVGWLIQTRRRRRAGARRARGARAWRLVFPALSAGPLQRWTTRILWRALGGTGRLAPPPVGELSERYADLLADSLGQPGYRELVLVAHDLDARADLIFALLAGPYRQAFFGSTGPEARQLLTAIDLAGAGRRHVLDAVWGAVALPEATLPHVVRFDPEGPWRGETHRLGHRPEALGGLLEALQRMGVEQAILVVATSSVPGPHGLGPARRDLRGAVGELLASREVAAVRDVLMWSADRLPLFVIQPTYNPVGPLDLRGAYDERSDRWFPVAELVYRGYEDAYRQFIEVALGPQDEHAAEPRGAGRSA